MIVLNKHGENRFDVNDKSKKASLNPEYGSYLYLGKDQVVRALGPVELGSQGGELGDPLNLKNSNVVSDAHTHPNEGKSFITVGEVSDQMNTNLTNTTSEADDKHFTSDSYKFAYHKKGFFDIMISKRNFKFTGNDGSNGNVQFDVPKTFKKK